MGLLCIDFSEGRNRVAGVITPSSLSRAGNDVNVCVGDIMNRRFRYTTIDRLDRDISQLNSISFMPVVDEGMNLLFVVYRESCHLWNDAQSFEIDWQRIHKFIKPRDSDAARLESPEMRLPKQYVSMIWEKAAKGHNTCIEIGSGPALGFIKDVPDSNKRIIIEPLCEQYAELRKQYGLTFKDEDSIVSYPRGGDIFISELKDSADIIFSHNVVDHTPEWPFILGNISEYARTGCLLYLANYIDHHEEQVSGHFNITYNPEKYLRLIRQFGFEIIWSDYWADSTARAETWVSCFARKI